MSSNRRKSVRRAIGYGAKIVAIDGSWQHDCRVVDVSDSGAKLTIQEQSGLPKDFVLTLSMDGKATRQCHVMWVKDSEIGVVFERRAQPRFLA
jgi:hypothetical protein